MLLAKHMEDKIMRRRVLLVLLITMFLAACTSRGDESSYQPDESDTDLEEWAERYPIQYEEWAASQHGQAYLDGNEDAPACLDCHDDPDTEEIKTAAFRLDIPNRCARCHSDADKMSEYDISADVYQTYEADYHGTTIKYYRDTAPDTWRYEAVCSDCHGSHEIYGPEDAKSTVSTDNLLGTCQTCHHDASVNFTTAFGHYRPARSPASSLESPLIFWVKLFYQVLIPVILASMIGYIVLDLRHSRAQQRTDHDK